jgi:hypothetical protein
MIDYQAKHLSATGTITSGPARLMYIYATPDSSPGTIELRNSSDNSGPILVTLNTPNTTNTKVNIDLRDFGMRFENGIHCTLTSTASITVFFTG